MTEKPKLARIKLISQAPSAVLAVANGEYRTLPHYASHFYISHAEHITSHTRIQLNCSAAALWDRSWRATDSTCVTLSVASKKSPAPWIFDHLLQTDVSPTGHTCRHHKERQLLAGRLGVGVPHVAEGLRPTWTHEAYLDTIQAHILCW